MKSFSRYFCIGTVDYKQMAEREGVARQLKADDPVCWALIKTILKKSMKISENDFKDE